MKRSCDELGLCQAQFGRPHCAACTREARANPFAPGVIEHYRRERALRAVRAGQVLIVVVLIAALGGLAVGYARGMGWL